MDMIKKQSDIFFQQLPWISQATANHVTNSLDLFTQDPGKPESLTQDPGGLNTWIFVAKNRI